MYGLRSCSNEHPKNGECNKSNDAIETAATRRQTGVSEPVWLQQQVEWTGPHSLPNARARLSQRKSTEHEEKSARPTEESCNDATDENRRTRGLHVRLP